MKATKKLWNSVLDGVMVGAAVYFGTQFIHEKGAQLSFMDKLYPLDMVYAGIAGGSAMMSAGISEALRPHLSKKYEAVSTDMLELVINTAIFAGCNLYLAGTVDIPECVLVFVATMGSKYIGQIIDPIIDY